MRLRSRAVARPDLATPLVELHLGYDSRPDSFAIDASEARELIATLRVAFGELGERLVSIEPVIDAVAIVRVDTPNEPVAVDGDADLGSWHQAKHDGEGAYLRKLNAKYRGNVSAMAREAKIDRKYMHTLLHKHGTHR